MWRWHALEETEHKAVAFDVYETAVGRNAGAYALRCASLVLTTLGFLSLVLYYQQRLLQADQRPHGWRDLRNYLKFMFVTPAMLPRLALPWLRYFRRDFHPWDHDNRHLLKEMDTLMASVQQYPLKAA